MEEPTSNVWPFWLSINAVPLCNLLGWGDSMFTCKMCQNGKQQWLEIFIPKGISSGKENLCFLLSALAFTRHAGWKSLDSPLHLLLHLRPSTVNSPESWTVQRGWHGELDRQCERVAPSGPERANPGLNSSYVTAKQRSCLGSSKAEKREVGRFWAMRKPKSAIVRNGEGLVNLWASRGCCKNKQAHTQPVPLRPGRHTTWLSPLKMGENEDVMLIILFRCYFMEV